MKRVFLGVLAVIILSSHDMFLKLDKYFLEPNTDVVIELFNGTFDQSDNVITRDRMLDVSMVENQTRTQIDTADWFEKDKTTYLNYTTGAPGTYVMGVSTKARSLAMSAEDFNDYLAHNGVVDMLELRKQNGTLGDSTVERYSKHIKTVFQVGNKLTDDYKTELGYPIEFVLLENPYDLHPGHSLPVKLLYHQKPLANQLVYVGSKATAHSHGGEMHTHDGESDHTHDDLLQLRTDEQGLLNVPITDEGVWYLKTIHLVESDEEGLTHESNWSTITFGIGSGHEHDDHGHEGGLPTYVYVIISLLIIAVLFLLYDRKKK